MTDEVFVFDTNHISSLLRKQHTPLLNRINNNASNILILCEPVIYEVEKGLHYKKANKQLATFRQAIIPLFTIVQIQLVDWRITAELWAMARRNGKQLADIDLLVAAITLRVNGVVVTADKDFDHLPNVPTINWLAT